MTDAFIAQVVGATGGDWTVTPKIIEHDGTTHPDITVSAVGGITPQVNDLVLVVTARNNLDNSPAPRYYMASEACGRIVAIVQTSAQYVFTGTFKWIGNLTFDGNVHVTGNLTVDGTLDATGNATMHGNLTVNGNATIDGTLSVGGHDVLSHNHSDPQGGTTGSGVWV